MSQTTDIRSKIDAMEKEIRAGLNLVEQEEFSVTIRAIAKVAAETVSHTLGPYAHTTIIDDGTFSYPTKDGWTVLSRLKFPDPLHQSIFRMLRQVSFRIVDKVGDGTTTAMVTAQHFIDMLMEELEPNGSLHGLRQADVVENLSAIRDSIVDELRMNCEPVIDPEHPDNMDGIFNVALISSNHNIQLATVMKEIYEQTHNPNILVDLNGDSRAISYEIQRGYRLDCKVLMKERYVNTSEGYYEAGGRPHLFCIFNHNVNYTKHADFIQDLIDYVVNGRSNQLQIQHTLVLVAPYFDDVFTASIAHMVNEILKMNPNAIPNIMLVQIPELSTRKVQNYLHDFAAIANVPITNGAKVEVYNEMRHNRDHDENEQIRDSRMELPEYKFGTMQELLESCVGQVTAATFGKDFINLPVINTESTLYKESMEQAKADLEKAQQEVDTSTTSLVKSLMEANDRITRLSGEIGVIHVGGASDIERHTMMDVVDDTFRACRAAFEHGIVPGMNMGTLLVLSNLMERYDHGYCYDIARILYNAFRATTMDILFNKKPVDAQWEYSLDTKDTACMLSAGELVDRIVEELDDSEITCYDIMTECAQTTGMPHVLNPVDTDIEIMNGIVSILGMVLTSDQYLSVARYYDKVAAQRQQEIGIAKDTKIKTTAELEATEEFYANHPNPLGFSGEEA